MLVLYSCLNSGMKSESRLFRMKEGQTGGPCLGWERSSIT